MKDEPSDPSVDTAPRGDASDPRVLREMVNASREAPMPELDWAKLEARVFAVIGDDATRPAERAPESDARDDRALEAVEEVRPSMLPGAIAAAVQLAPAEAARVSRTAPPQRRYGWLGAFAVAAAFALAWFAREAPRGSDVAVVSEPIDPMKLPVAAGMPGGTRDVAALNRGDVVEAALGPVSFGKLGVLEWTLAAGGRLAVRQALSSSLRGENHEVELESGSIDGAVSDEHELVVFAGDTQVSTVGPATLNITRSSQRLVVDLKTGSAAIGRRGERSNVRVLSAPVRASFSLDGGLKFEVIPDAPVAAVNPEAVANPGPVDAPPSEPAPVTTAASEAKPNNAKSVASAPAAPASVSASADGAGPALSDAAVSSTLMSCLAGVRAKEQGSGASGVSVSVASTLTVQTRDDGSVKSASFNPPLRGEMQSCAVFLFRSKLTGGARTLAVPISL